jgi:integrase
MGKDLKGKELGTGLCQGKDGRYIIRWTDNYGKRHTKYANKLKEAKEILTVEKYKVQMWQDTETNTQITLNNLFEIYMDVSKQKLAKSTLINKVEVYNKYVRNLLGDLPIKKINKQTIRKYCSDLEDKDGYNPKRALVALKPLFRFAVAEEYIIKNPTQNVVCANTRIKKSKGERDKVLTNNEQKELIEFLLKSNYLCKYAYLFLLGSGLRIGELLALKVEDIDIENNYVNVNKTVKEVLNNGKKVVVAGATKSKAGNRKVPLTELSLLAYTEQLKMFKQNGIILKSKDILFPLLSLKLKKIKNKKAINEYARVRTWDEQFRRLVAKCRELHPDFPMITPHSLRHTFATRCYEGEISAKAAQSWLGHSSTVMTQYYQHLTEENIKPDIARLSTIMKL